MILHIGIGKPIDVVRTVSIVVMMNGQRINVALTIKNLGLLLDGLRNFEKLVDFKIGKCHASLKHLYR